jgi:tRNA 2-thiouridine synthesizing protein A
MPEYDDEIDAIGLKCPMPILKCKKGLNALKINQILRIKTTDKSAKKILKLFVKILVMI